MVESSAVRKAAVTSLVVMMVHDLVTYSMKVANLVDSMVS